MATLRNGAMERISFSDTELDAALLLPEEGDSDYGLDMRSGFHRVLNGNAVEGPRQPRRQAARRQRQRMWWRMALALLTAAASLAAYLWLSL